MPRGKGNKNRRVAAHIAGQTAKIISQAKRLDKTKACTELLQGLMKALQPCMPVVDGDETCVTIPTSSHGKAIFIAYTAAKQHLEGVK